MNCSKCGKELFDEAVICPACGCPVERVIITEVKSNPSPPESIKTSEIKMNKRRKMLVRIIILAVVVMILGVLSTIVLSRPNLKLSDIKPCNKFSAIMQYGIPTSDHGNYFAYDDCIKFYGINVKTALVYFDEGTIVLYFSNDNDYESAWRKIESAGKLKDYNGVYHTYTYMNIQVDDNSKSSRMLIFNIY